MTTFGKNAKNIGIRSRLDELDMFINAAIVSGDKKAAEEMTEIKKELSDFFDDLKDIVDENAEKNLMKTLNREAKKFLENDE